MFILILQYYIIIINSITCFMYPVSRNSVVKVSGIVDWDLNTGGTSERERNYIF